MKVNCKECDKELNVPDDAVKGEIVTCPDCGSDFEIVSVSNKKVELKTAEKVGEDWGE
ncbi:MAG: alpha-aminoadipate carrier protein LysW [Candidatus Nitrosomirales archaeon]|jgi:alpha-aminoadipate carrier protein LysW